MVDGSDDLPDAGIDFLLCGVTASRVALYWTVSNAYQVGQTLLLSNQRPRLLLNVEKDKAEQSIGK